MISTRESGARILALACDLAPRMPVSAAATASRTSGCEAAAEPRSAAVGHEAWWIEPSCHHDQTSSVA